MTGDGWNHLMPELIPEPDLIDGEKKKTKYINYLKNRILLIKYHEGSIYIL
jgi:hypothetical protein